MTKYKVAEEMARLQVLCFRYVERNTKYKMTMQTVRNVERIAMKNKLRIDYLSGACNLEENILNYCQDSKYLLDAVVELKENIIRNEMCDLRFGENLNNNFSEEEKLLEHKRIEKMLNMSFEMTGITEAAEYLEINAETIKKAAQEERLLNTKKVGKTWLVYIPECRDYWHIESKEA